MLDLKYFLKKLLYVICIGALLECVFVYYVTVRCPQRSEGVGSPGIGVKDACVPLCGCWESNPCPLEKQQVSLSTETSLQPLKYFFLYYK